MSNSCQAPAKYQTADLVTFSCDFPHGHHIAEHSHLWDQFLYGCRGVMTVETQSGTWVVPPQRAVWVPAGMPHAISMSGAVTMTTLYLVTRLTAGLPRDCCVMNVSPFLRELVLHACQWEMLRCENAPEGRLIGVLLDQLRAVESEPLQLPHPSDERGKRVAALLLDNPADTRSLDQLAADAGASKRTIERIFQAQTHMSFGRWRQQLSLLHALRLLAAGQKVTSVALDSGYSSPSAFISMFRKTLGTTPGDYFRV